MEQEGSAECPTGPETMSQDRRELQNEFGPLYHLSQRGSRGNGDPAEPLTVGHTMQKPTPIKIKSHSDATRSFQEVDILVLEPTDSSCRASIGRYYL